MAAGKLTMKTIEMKLCIIGFNNLYLMQYLYKYTNILDKQGIQYDVVYWNREEQKEEPKFQGRAIEFECKMDSFQPLKRKIKYYFQYIRFIHKILRRGNYKKIIVLTTQAAVSMAWTLMHQYSGRYIYDYRDITKEYSLRSYQSLVKALISRSYCSMFSSIGFIHELDCEISDKCIISHNTREPIQHTQYSAVISHEDPIRIVYWGTIRQLAFNKIICDFLGNDARFTLVFHGMGLNRELEEYSKSKNYTNISFTGRYTMDKIPGFVETTDVLHCMYENDVIQKLAMPVKAYDAIKYRLPVIVSSGSVVAEFFSGCQAALALEMDNPDAFRNKLYGWYRQLQAKSVEAALQDCENKIMGEEIAFEKKLVAFAKDP